MTEEMDTMLSDTLVHRAELTSSLGEIRREAGGSACKRFPSRFAQSIWARLSGRSVPEWLEKCGDVNHSIRQIHDYYGWMAKRGPRGECAGTLYRSIEFMKVERSARNGTQGPGRNVHIEHTVPVSDLEKTLKNHINEFQGASDLHWFLLRHSVCVALTAREERELKASGVPPSRNKAFNRRGERELDFPFRRYQHLASHSTQRGFAFRIVNVVLGTEVDLGKFTFEDHVATLQEASRLEMPERDGAWLYRLEVFKDTKSLSG